VLDINGMRFAHGMGAMLALIGRRCVARQPVRVVVRGCVAILKTTSALGWCPAYKCMAASRAAAAAP